MRWICESAEWRPKLKMEHQTYLSDGLLRARIGADANPNRDVVAQPANGKQPLQEVRAAGRNIDLVKGLGVRMRGRNAPSSSATRSWAAL